MFLIDASSLKLDIQPVNRTMEGEGEAYEEWIYFLINIATPNFNGNIKWAAMPDEIRRFKEAIVEMNDLEEGKQASLYGVEPGLEIKLTMGSQGKIQGGYQFSGAFTDADAPILSGGFEIDQSYLSDLENKLDQLLSS